jgi:hypothetical protein
VVLPTIVPAGRDKERTSGGASPESGFPAPRHQPFVGIHSNVPGLSVVTISG